MCDTVDKFDVHDVSSIRMCMAASNPMVKPWFIAATWKGKKEKCNLYFLTNLLLKFVDIDYKVQPNGLWGIWTKPTFLDTTKYRINNIASLI